MTAVPLVLAGPILRRVAPDRVCVWCATSVAADVRVEIVRQADPRTTLGSATARRVRLGARLHVHLAVVPAPDGGFPEDELLAYDVQVRHNGHTRRLWDLGLLSGHARIAYPGFTLPTFFIPPPAAALHLLHGSCRLLHGHGEDALIMADEVLARTARAPDERPSALLLTGDQVYGDEVAGPLARPISALGREVIGAGDDTSVPGLPPLSQIPLYGRQELMLERARFTSSKAHNHLASFGEFAGMYLVSWNERLWPPTLPRAADAVPPAGSGLRPASLRRRLLYQYQAESRGLAQARAGLAAVRRVFANVPTFMVFDDHDVTDDWNLTRRWHDEVWFSPTGRRIVANALAAFWAFQGWGNDPDLFDDAFVRTISTHLCGDGDGAAYDAALWSFDGWSFLVPTSPPVLALDTRTQRSFDSLEGAARLIGEQECERVRQLGQRARAGRSDRPLVLISPVPMFGLELQERRQKFLVGRLGPYEIDFEAWHSNLQGLIDFLCLLIEDLEVRSCVVLSGDVHYGLNVRVDIALGERRLVLAQLVSSSIKHGGHVSRATVELVGSLVTKSHERIAWKAPPQRALNGLARWVINKAANTDQWSADAPVFLGPRRADLLGIQEPPDYRAVRRYLRPAERLASVVIGDHNMGLVRLDGGQVVHRLLGRHGGQTHTYTATIDLVPDARLTTGREAADTAPTTLRSQGVRPDV